MSYKFIKDLSIADIAFEVEGNTLDQLFSFCAEALSSTIIKNFKDIRPKTKKSFEISSDIPELLLVDFMNKLIFFKDSEELIFREVKVDVIKEAGLWKAKCEAKGDRLDPKKMEFLVDVKAATLHMLKLENLDGSWKTRVVLDI